MSGHPVGAHHIRPVHDGSLMAMTRPAEYTSLTQAEPSCGAASITLPRRTDANRDTYIRARRGFPGREKRTAPLAGSPAAGKSQTLCSARVKDFTDCSQKSQTRKRAVKRARWSRDQRTPWTAVVTKNPFFVNCMNAIAIE